MDRWRAAGALLALAACIACSAAAPTASNHTALDLYDGVADGCYYNFQHYGEGDRIMTNEPCLNCTCHNRMLMCYLRVCPFTKPIGQDCTVEKRADQCCPIVTCPDVPVDLLTSTSTSSPAEYGATGIGKLDKYGCSINGKYFSEGSKVPPTPNKPCEHCYCIRNMTTCVMQECTLHVDGCTPIYHKDVCCPVRYSCDHQEDEILLLDDMTTTVRPTPGFLLTTTTVAPVTQMTQDCAYNGKAYPDGGHIKTENACDHCYCMKGDIVCVVQECGTPMENEGKNCSSLLPREGQCCPDTYICEGDESGTEVSSEVTTEQILEELTTLVPPRRVGVEGSGYRNEPDEIPYTETPILEPEVEGSGEEQPLTPPQSTNELLLPEHKPGLSDEILETTEDVNEFISFTTKKSVTEETITTIAHIAKEHAEVSTGIFKEDTTESHEFIPYTTIDPFSDESEHVTSDPSEEKDIISNTNTEKEMSEEFEPSTSISPTLEEVESTTTKPKEQGFVTFGTSDEKTTELHPSTTSASILEVESEIATVKPVEQDTITDGVTDKETSEYHKHILSTTSIPSIGKDDESTNLHEETEPEKHEIVTDEIEKEIDTLKPLEHHTVTHGINDDESSEPNLYKQTTTSSPALKEEEKLSTEFEGTEIAETESVKPHEYIPTTASSSKFEEDESINTDREQDVASGITEASLEPEQYVPTEITSVLEESDQTSTELLNKETEVPSSGIPENEISDTHRYIPSTTTVSELEENIKVTTETNKEQEIASGTTNLAESSESYQYIPSTTGSPYFDDSEAKSTETSKVQDIVTVESHIQDSNESIQYVPSTNVPTPEEGVRATTEAHKEQDLFSEVTTEEESSTSHKYLPSSSVPVLEVTTGNSLEESSKEHDYSTSTLSIASLEDSEKITTTEPDKGLNTIPSGVVEEESSEPSVSDRVIISEDTSSTEAPLPIHDKQTNTIEPITTTMSEFSSYSSESYVSKDDQYTVTTEPTLRKEDDSEVQPVTHKAELTNVTASVTEEVISTPSHIQSGSTETIVPSIEQETKATTIPLPEYTDETKETTISKEPTNESFLETTISTGSAEKELVSSPVIESEGISTTPAIDKLVSRETTTINPGENEIHEDAILTPGRIPGEGDCLLDSVTYRNNSIVPSTNKCHSDCKCISSIIKCNPIICSPPPDYMNNCQSIYDSPESCCPTYICDHSRETMPPQPHSQMSGTETPAVSPTIECHGDECEVREDIKPSAESSELCTTGNCIGESSDKPESHTQVIPEHHKECAEGKCTQTESCANGECQPPPIQDLLCTKENGCQASPVKPCEGESCQAAPVDDLPQKPQICANEEHCKDLNVSETPKQTQKDIQCTGSDCVQQVPVLSESTTDTQLSAESPAQDHTAQEKIEQEENMLTTISNLHETKPISTMASEEDHTGKLDTSSKAPEYAYTDTNKLMPEIPEEYEVTTKESESNLGFTDITELHETGTKEQETEVEYTATDYSESKTSAIQPEITTELIKIETSSKKESTLIGEPVTEYAEALSTKSPEILGIESVDTQTGTPKIPIEKQELETKEPPIDEIQTESPYTDVTKEHTHKTDHIETETELSDILKTEEEHTEGSQTTKDIVIYTEEPEASVTDHYETSSKSSEQEESYTELQQETKSPEIIEDMQHGHDRSTESSMLPDIELDQKTREPELTLTEPPEVITKLPITETSQEFVTESYIPDGISTITEEHIKKELSESTAPYLNSETTPSATKSVESTSVITEAPIEEEISTKASLPDVTISDKRTTESPIKEEEKEFVSKLDHVTKPEIAVTNKEEDIIKDLTTSPPEISVSEEEAKSTMEPEIIDLDKYNTILPQSHVTEVVHTPSEVTEPTVLTQEAISTEYEPESEVTQVHDFSQSQEETSSNLPAAITTSSEEDFTRKTVISVSDEHTYTESPVSEVTQKVDLLSPTTERDVTENEESKTVLPDISVTGEPIKLTEIPYDSQDKTSELYEPEKIATEGPVEQEIKTEYPEVVIPEKETPTTDKIIVDIESTGLEEETKLPLVPEEENKTEHPGKLTEQGPLDDETESGTGKPVTSLEEKELSTPDHSKPVTDIYETSTKPQIIQEETSTEHQKLSTETNGPLETLSESYIPVQKETSTETQTTGDSTTAEYVENEPGKPLKDGEDNKKITKPTVDEENTYTHVPEHTPTESEDSESKTPDNIMDDDHATKAPETSSSYEYDNKSEGATSSVTEEHESYTDFPEVPAKEGEIPTEIPPEVPVTEEEIKTEIPVSLVTESHIINTNVPIEVINDQDQETTENLEHDIVTKEPDTYTTEKQETTTNTPIAHKTTPQTTDSDSSVTQKEIEMPEVLATELPLTSTKLAESMGTGLEKLTTELPGSETKTQQSDITESPEIFTKDHSIVDIHKITTELSPITEATQKEISSVTETRTENIWTPTSEPATEQETDITEKQEVHVAEQAQLQTESPLSLTESVEASTKIPEVYNVVKHDTVKPHKATEVQEPSQETYTETQEIVTEITKSAEGSTTLAEISTHKPEVEKTTTPDLDQALTTHPIELEEYTHKIKDEISTASPSEKERTTINIELTKTDEPIATTEKLEDEKLETATKEQENKETDTPSKETTETDVHETPSSASTDVSEKTTLSSTSISEMTTVSPDTDSKHTIVDQTQEVLPSMPTKPVEDDHSVSTIVPDADKPLIHEESTKVQTEHASPATDKPLPVEISFQTTALEEEFILATTKGTTVKFEEEVSTQSPSVDKFTKPEDAVPATAPEISKPVPSEIQPTDEAPTPEEESHFPASGVSGYGPEPDYVEEDQAFGPGTCRYGGKVYVSAQQIPRDDPCDFCFCFRSDIICLQQSCPPPIHGCHEEPIQGFCCPRYECPVSMATTLNVTTTTTTTTTTLPPHFPTHSYKGAAQRRGCQIKGHTYKVGEVVRASSGPCLHCTCGGDGQMKCDPKACTPEPMLRQMIAAAVSAKRRR